MTTASRSSLPRWVKWLIYVVLFGAMLALIVGQLPRGAYPTDLSRIGQGRPALVLAYDINSLGGMEAMERLNPLRDQFAERVEFLVAHLGEPGGIAFARRYDAINGTVMLFSGDGAHLRTLTAPVSTNQLRGGLDDITSRLNQ